MNVEKKIDTIRKKYFEDVRPRGLEYQPEPPKQKYKLLELDKMKNLTWKSIVVIALVSIAKFVLAQWFDEPALSQIVETLTNVLNALLGVGVAGAIWGVRRRVDGV